MEEAHTALTFRAYNLMGAGVTGLALVKHQGVFGGGQRFLPGKSGCSNASRPGTFEMDNRVCPPWLERTRVKGQLIITNSSNKPHRLGNGPLPPLEDRDQSDLLCPTRF